MCVCGNRVITTSRLKGTEKGLDLWKSWDEPEDDRYDTREDESIGKKEQVRGCGEKPGDTEGRCVCDDMRWIAEGPTYRSFSSLLLFPHTVENLKE